MLTWSTLGSGRVSDEVHEDTMGCLQCLVQSIAGIVGASGPEVCPKLGSQGRDIGADCGADRMVGVGHEAPTGGRSLTAVGEGPLERWMASSYTVPAPPSMATVPRVVRSPPHPLRNPRGPTHWVK